MQAFARWFDLRRLFIGAVLLILLIPAIQPMTDPDFWWHLTTGNWILAHHAVPRHDLFTYTVSDHRWITHEWLSEVLLGAVFAAGRLPLVNLALGLVTAAGFLLVFRAIDPRTNFLVRTFAVLLGVAAANPIWGPRIQMITFALAALTYLWIQRFCEGRSRALFLLPAVVLVWANLHAGFFTAYGFLMIALAAEGLKLLLRRPEAMPIRRLRQLGLVLLACIAVAVVNPNGWLIYPYALQTLSSPVQQKLIVEWFSPNFQMPEIWFFEAMIFLLLVGLAAARRIDLRQLLLLLAGLALALHSVRNLPLFTVVAVPALAACAQQALDRWGGALIRRRPLPANVLTLALNTTVLLVLALAVLVAIRPALSERTDGSLVARDYPIAAANFLNAHPPPGHMLNQYGWGGYLIYRLYPKQPVFVFGDAAVTGDRLLEDYARIVYITPAEPDLLDHYDVNWVIFKADDPLITTLRQANPPGRPGWFELGTYGQAVILMRDNAENRLYAEQSRG
ncbi:MAG: hypothetical protein E6J00_08220 [Chloroflexi bacterium]|nr:MAG: hypothetical protein E6J00_08220 [Chloroflexota bacterium]